MEYTICTSDVYHQSTHKLKEVCCMIYNISMWPVNLSLLPSISNNQHFVMKFGIRYQQHMFLIHNLPFPFSFLIFIPDHPILQTLETRTGDKMAQDFVKKQKLRISNSQCNTAYTCWYLLATTIRDLSDWICNDCDQHIMPYICPGTLG